MAFSRLSGNTLLENPTIRKPLRKRYITEVKRDVFLFTFGDVAERKGVIGSIFSLIFRFNFITYLCSWSN